MTDPALDGPDAERAIVELLNGLGTIPDGSDIDAAIHALNEQGVTLCDEHALTELRQQAKASEAWQAERADWMQVARIGRGNERYVRFSGDYSDAQRTLAAEAFGFDLSQPWTER